PRAVACRPFGAPERGAAASVPGRCPGLLHAAPSGLRNGGWRPRSRGVAPAITCRPFGAPERVGAGGLPGRCPGLLHAAPSGLRKAALLLNRIGLLSSRSAFPAQLQPLLALLTSIALSFLARASLQNSRVGLVCARFASDEGSRTAASSM